MSKRKQGGAHRPPKPAASSHPQHRSETSTFAKKSGHRVTRNELASRMQNAYDEFCSDEESGRRDFRAHTADDQDLTGPAKDSIASSDDEEIEEDEAFNSEDEARYGHFKFHSSETISKHYRKRASSDSDSALSSDDQKGSAIESDDDDMVDLSEMLTSTSKPAKDLAQSFISAEDIPSSSEDEEGQEAEDLGTLIDTVLKDKSAPSRKKRKLEEKTEAYAENEFGLPARPDTQVNVSTLLNALAANTEGGDQAFGKLKRQAVQLHHENEETKREAAPLPERLQAKLQRQVAYQSTREDVDKWQNIVSRNAERKTLKFPLQTEKPARSTAALAADYKPKSALDMAIADVVKSSSLNEAQIEQDLPFNPVDPEQVKARRLELRAMRDLAFRHEIKMKRRAKIKSKAFRRVMKKERLREKEQELQHMLETDPDAAREHLIRMELERAKGRVTLKNKSKAKWAQFMLNHGAEGAHATRQEILEQLQEEDDLKKRIEGIAATADGSDQDDANESPAISDDETPANAKGLYAMKFMVNGAQAKQRALQEAEENERESLDGGSDDDAPLPGRRFVGFHKDTDKQGGRLTLDDVNFSMPNNADASAGEENPWVQNVGASTESEGKHANLGKLQRKQAKLLETLAHKNSSQAQEVSLEVDVDKLVAQKEPEDPLGEDKDPMFLKQQDLVAMAFAGDSVVEEFEEEKAQVEAADAPQQIDETLPGWGSWVGGKIAPKKNIVVRHQEGIEKHKRKDAKLKHVIISEKQQKKLLKYTTPSIPHPFQTKRQYEMAMRQTIGKEWTTAESFRSLSAPKVEVQAGNIIQPLKFIKQEADAFAEKKKKERAKLQKERREQSSKRKLSASS